MSARAIVSHVDHGRETYLVVKCPLGHLIQARLLDSSYAGSMMQADVAAHQGGHETHWDRLAARCEGAGHERFQVEEAAHA